MAVPINTKWYFLGCFSIVAQTDKSVGLAEEKQLMDTGFKQGPLPFWHFMCGRAEMAILMSKQRARRSNV